MNSGSYPPRPSSGPRGFSCVSRAFRWLGISAAVGLAAGSASALFLALLDAATAVREDRLWLIALLPAAGLATGWAYHRMARGGAERGTPLLIDEIHDPQNVIPFRMAPLVLFGTLATHLFGGSAGREGTAVQMAGAIADRLTAPLRLSAEDRRTLLMSGMSAGFGSVFGTPFAGAVFGLEVLRTHHLRLRSVLPCLAASIIADLTTRAWGIHHAGYSAGVIPPLSWRTVGWAAAAGLVFGLGARLFAGSVRLAQKGFQKAVASAAWRPAVGGAVVAAAVFLLGTDRYIGLGLPVIAEAFTSVLSPAEFFQKTFYTAVTLGSGFKGGEVTPLFFVGATLGSALGKAAVLPGALLAALGFAAVFAGAAAVPLTGAVMAMEVFGPSIAVYALIACGVSHFCARQTH